MAETNEVNQVNQTNDGSVPDLQPAEDTKETKDTKEISGPNEGSSADQEGYQTIDFTVEDISLAKDGKYRYRIKTDGNITVAQVKQSEDPNLVVNSDYRAYYTKIENRVVHLLSSDEGGEILNLNDNMFGIDDEGHDNTNRMVPMTPGSSSQHAGIIPLEQNKLRKYLKIPNQVPDEEIEIAIHKCFRLGLDPINDEVYLIPRNDKRKGHKVLTLTISVYSFIRKANDEPDYQGFEAGLVLLNKDNQIIHRPGTIKLADEKVIGGYAKVFRDGMKQPFTAEVSMDEYAGDKDLWVSHSRTMIRKTAITHAMREAYPQRFAGVYEQAEFGDELDPADGYEIKDVDTHNQTIPQQSEGELQAVQT